MFFDFVRKVKVRKAVQNSAQKLKPPWNVPPLAFEPVFTYCFAGLFGNWWHAEQRKKSVHSPKPLRSIAVSVHSLLFTILFGEDKNKCLKQYLARILQYICA